MLQYVELGGSVALSRETNTQPDVTHVALTSSSIARLIFRSVEHGRNDRSSVRHSECTCASKTCKPVGVNGGSSAWGLKSSPGSFQPFGASKTERETKKKKQLQHRLKVEQTIVRQAKGWNFPIHALIHALSCVCSYHVCFNVYLINGGWEHYVIMWSVGLYVRRMFCTLQLMIG